MSIRLGIDVGGTFMDLVGLLEGEVRLAKVPSTPDDPVAAIVSARSSWRRRSSIW